MAVQQMALRMTLSPNAKWRIEDGSPGRFHRRKRWGGQAAIERMERTSPTRYGIEVPRLKWIVINRHERGSHGEDYYCRSGFGKAGDGRARGVCRRAAGVAQGV